MWGHTEPPWSYLRLQMGPFQKRRREDKQLLENIVASAVFSRALDDKNTHVAFTESHRKSSDINVTNTRALVEATQS